MDGFSSVTIVSTNESSVPSAHACLNLGSLLSPAALHIAKASRLLFMAGLERGDCFGESTKVASRNDHAIDSVDWMVVFVFIV